MRTARDGILARARLQRGTVRALLLRHSLTLRLVGDDGAFASVGASPQQEDVLLRRRFYRPIALTASAPVAPSDMSVVGGYEQEFSPEIAYAEPTVSGEAVAKFAAPTSVSRVAPVPPPATVEIPETPLQPEAVFGSDTEIVNETLPPSSQATAPLTAQTQLDRIKAMMGQGNRPSAVITPPVVLPADSVSSAQGQGSTTANVEIVPPRTNRRRQRVEEIISGEPPVPQSAESPAEPMSVEPAATTEPPRAKTPPRPQSLPPGKGLAETPPSVRSSTPTSLADESDTLFTPVQAAESRTPAAWLARLKGKSSNSPRPTASTTEPVPTVVTPSVPEVVPPVTPTPVSQTARRVLRPLVGIDPADVPTYRGPEAHEAAQALGADAFAVGSKAIVLGAAAETAGDNAPETLGLLAHELTHIAKQRTPQFVPPILAAPRQSAVPPVPPTGRTEALPQAAVSDAVTYSESEGEEATAQRVESQVRRYAAALTENAAVAPTPEVEQGGSTAEPAAISLRPTAPTVSPPVNTEDWNGLPAPWEPLPGFMRTPGNLTAETISVMSSVSPQNAVLSSVSAENTVGEAPLIQRAPEDRSLPETVPVVQADSPALALAPVPVAPDLDVLARQVYDKLKRRLAAEQRQRLR